MRVRMLIGVAAVVALGCGGGVGGQKVAPVSGTVTLDGQPLANATVSFQPVAPKGSIYAGGPGSSGQTNEKGEFKLTLMTGGTGAVVGKHRVLITSLSTKDDDSDARVKPRGGPELVNKVPERYGPGEKDEITFEVPAGGTDKANFPLTSR